ncbi:lysophospholipid acyltransferase LPCAT4 [Sigmodon hispidus]
MALGTGKRATEGWAVPWPHGHGCKARQSRMISQEAFAQQLQLSDPQTVTVVFSYVQQDADDLMDFRNAALALVPLDGGRSLEELICLAFELFAEEQAEGLSCLLYKDGFNTILHMLLGSPHPTATTLHAELCQSGCSQGLSLCRFQNFSLYSPLYGKLFSTYLPLPHKPQSTSQTANASSPSSPTALANGTLKASKQKED